MQRSESIVELATALAKAQAAIEGAVKGNENPHFRSRYADLGAVWEAVREPLTKNGLSVVQFPRASEGHVELETMLLHTSGQYMADILSLPVSKNDAQGYGSAITYARRYALMAVAGIAPVDDDGNEAVVGGPKPIVKTAAPVAVPAPPKPVAKPAMTPSQWTDAALVAIKGFKTPAELGKWQAENAKAIDKLDREAPADHTRIMDALNERLDSYQVAAE